MKIWVIVSVYNGELADVSVRATEEQAYEYAKKVREEHGWFFVDVCEQEVEVT